MSVSSSIRWWWWWFDFTLTGIWMVFNMVFVWKWVWCFTGTWIRILWINGKIQNKLKINWWKLNNQKVLCICVNLLLVAAVCTVSKESNQYHKDGNTWTHLQKYLIVYFFHLSDFLNIIMKIKAHKSLIRCESAKNNEEKHQ